MPHTQQSLLSKITITLSSLCVVHCMLTPFIILLLPALADLFSERIENVLILSIVPISMVAFLSKWWHHRNTILLVLLSAGLLLVLYSQFFLHGDHEAVRPSTGLTTAQYMRSGMLFSGATLVAFSVYRINRHTHVCNHPEHQHERIQETITETE